MDEEISIKDVRGSIDKIKPGVRTALYWWFIITMMVILLILVYYKGMSAQCQDLGMNLYWADTDRGFECKEPTKWNIVRKDDSFDPGLPMQVPIVPEGEL